MAKNEIREYSLKDFCKFILKSWPILVICLALGGALAVLSYKQQAVKYSSTAIIMVHDNDYEYNGYISPYVQILAILQSEEAYEAAGVDMSDVAFDSIAINEKMTGVFELNDSNIDQEKAVSDLKIMTENAEKVIAKAYDGEKNYKVTSLKKPGEPVANTTLKDKLFSSALILAISIFVAIAIDFVAFNKKAE